jgi:hypothetical protein
MNAITSTKKKEVKKENKSIGSINRKKDEELNLTSNDDNNDLLNFK